MKTPRINFPRRRTVMKGMNDTWQMDLICMENYARANKNYKYILALIDIFSKFAYVFPLKTKSGKEVAKALDEQLKRTKNRPKKIHCDQGREFFNKDVAEILKKYGIQLFHTYSSMKAYICERFIRTFKRILHLNIKIRGSLKYIDLLPQLIDHYNYKMKHRTIGMCPGEVTKKDELRLLRDVYSYETLCKNGPRKLNLGDVVRISKQRTTFHKGYNLNWTTELFTVSDIHNTCPITYSIIDENNKPILGKFYRHELQKTALPGVYLVEKVLKKRNDKLYVKWLGMDVRSWIAKDKVLER